MKAACILLLIVVAVLASGCTTAAPATPPVPPATTAATPAIPDISGTWTGPMQGYEEGTGYTDYPAVTMAMVVSEQHGRIFSGSFLCTPSNGTVIKSEFAGVIARDGRLLDIVEKGGGYCTGEVVAKNEIELKYMYDGTPYSIASDSLKRV